MPSVNLSLSMQKITADSPDAKSADLVSQNLGHLRTLFPDAWVEGKVDFDVLRQLLGGAVDEREEKFGLSWYGKRKARQLALTPSTGTLRPCPRESEKWDTTQNLMIEGDNLEVLKLLQKSYAGQVKLIYIDPPYNTGKDFIYPDDFQDNIRNYLELTGQVKGGKKMVANTEASGRFHTDWLNMMLPRLKLAQNLLRNDGFVFISINDIEAHSLRLLCGEVFGEENFVATFIWNTEGHTDNQLQVKVNHEYVICYGKTKEAVLENIIDPNTRKQSNLWQGFAENSITQNGPGNPVREIEIPEGFPCESESLSLPAHTVPAKFMSEVDSLGYISRDLTRNYDISYPIRKDPLIIKDHKVAKPCRMLTGWKSFAQLKEFIDGGLESLKDDDGSEKRFYLSANGVVYYYKKRSSARNILTVLRNMGTTEQARYGLEESGIPFQYPKPVELLKYLLRAGSKANQLVVDLFAGSCPLAAAAIEMANSEDGWAPFYSSAVARTMRSRF